MSVVGIDARFDVGAWARGLGWTDAGWCRPELSAVDIERFREWLKISKGPGLGYIERRQLEREDPRRYFPAAKVVIVFSLSYFHGWSESPNYKISSYAWGRDYHEILKAKLESSVAVLQKLMGPFQYKIAVDTAPLLEKVLAVKAGLGWQGKNSLLLTTRQGSQIFLGELLCDLEVDRFAVRTIESDHCGTCRRCIDACPTEALTPYSLNASRCISYWNLEHKGNFNELTPPLHGWVAGCDICQEVCPWNARLVPVNNETAENLQASLKGPLALYDLESEAWSRQREATALNYLSSEQWARNLRFSHQ